MYSRAREEVKARGERRWGRLGTLQLCLPAAGKMKGRTVTGCKVSPNEKQTAREPKFKKNTWTTRAGRVAALLLGDRSVIMLMAIKDDTGTNKASFI